MADLVAVGMVREMAAMMTAIVMTGRTGAAYAAELGTMTVNEEVDALRTFGFPPMELLVVPRVVALILVLPMLVLFADFVGILGGGLVALTMDVSFTTYFGQVRECARPDGVPPRSHQGPDLRGGGGGGRLSAGDAVRAERGRGG